MVCPTNRHYVSQSQSLIKTLLEHKIYAAHGRKVVERIVRREQVVTLHQILQFIVGW